ncbi:RNA polymerase II transcriptional coactivator KIWI-like [Vitis riparia]|uniref:RNA polymerase II transcriptional coactivator KIWI-like n=1 Tax=Vitis riparia TaxID=96939 RepID=UPI00155A78DC|nr:RNA polymerase II transcriptional coactivator KIWI-like [Vitis riparia]
MSKWGKRKQSYASDGDSDDHASSKKSSMKDSDDPDNIIVCEISRNRRVSVRNWQGKVQVDIREFYVKDGKQMPGKKGISLTMDQWNVLRDHVNEIDEAVADNA